MHDFHFQMGPPPISVKGALKFGVIGAVVGGLFITAVPNENLQEAVVIVIAFSVLGGIIGLFVDGAHSPIDRGVPKKKLVNGDCGSMAQSQASERAWAAVGYFILFGLGVTLFGGILRFFVHDWWPLLIAAVGMLFVVIALWLGQILEQPQPTSTT